LALRDAPHAAAANARTHNANRNNGDDDGGGSGGGGNNVNDNSDDAHLFDAAFDRGGLVAVAPADRRAYARTLATLLKPTTGRLLLVCTEHPPFAGGSLGPPHSVLGAEVASLFGGAFAVELLQVEDRLGQEPSWRDRGCTWFREATYLLTRTSAAATDAGSEHGSGGESGHASGISSGAALARGNGGIGGAATQTTTVRATAAAADRAAAQCGSVLASLGAQLVAAGCEGGLHDAAFVHLYLRDMNHFAAVKQKRRSSLSCSLLS
jgi:thiopurine S-methyltransferase